MGRVFVLDSSAIVDAWKYWYGPDTHPDFWDCLLGFCEGGSVVVPMEVLDELRPTGSDDAMGTWLAKHRPELGKDSTGPIQGIVGRLQTQYPSFGGSFIGAKNYADPFVVAHALALTTEDAEAVIVTHERMAKKSAPPRIPNVCQSERLKVREIHQVVKAHGLSFRLA